MRRILIFTILTAFMMGLLVQDLNSCTNFLVSKGASKDGSVMITYAADSHSLYGELYFTPAGYHIKGTKLKVYDWDTGVYLGEIDQVERTYSVVGNMNEHQLAISETTFGGRRELRNKKGIIDYGSLIYITLQRAKTAREAIKTMGQLVEKYGYYSSGESFSIADKNEVWIMEMIGKGEEKGAVWVARRVPEGYICAHANQARIRTFPQYKNKKKVKKPDCYYSDDVISFARKKGYFKGEDKDFSFTDAYAPLSFGSQRFCEARVWSFFNRIAPSMKKHVEYAKGVEGAEPMPLWIKPENGKVSARDLMEYMRDHYEGTELDMTKDLGAGPYKLPYRWRPLTWKAGENKYFNERATATQQTAFSFVAQLRSNLPDTIGGVLWFGVDDAASSVYVPMYGSMSKAPYNFRVGTGSFEQFTWDSAFWVFNFVANYTYSRYSDMIQDVQLVQRELEGNFLAKQAETEAAALKLYRQSPELAREYLTKYSCEMAAYTVKRWKKLGEHLIFKYLDGNVKNEKGKVTHPGYPEEWRKRVADSTGDKLKSIQWKKKEAQH